MFDEDSRYAKLEVKTHTLPDGREAAYAARRFPPEAASLTTVGEIAVPQGARLDRLTAEALGDPTHFWRLADANNAMDPEELTDETGRVLTIPLPTP